MIRTMVITSLIIIAAGFGAWYDMTRAPAISQAPQGKGAVPSIPLPVKNTTWSEVTQGAVPAFTIIGRDGSELSPARFKGKVILLNFWATWCAPCRKEFPSMIRLLEAFKGEVVMLALSTDVAPHAEAAEQKWQAFFSTLQPPQESDYLYIAWDGKRTITQDIFNVLRMPETIIINPEGEMVRKVVGGDLEWDSPDMQAYIRHLLGQ